MAEEKEKPHQDSEPLADGIVGIEGTLFKVKMTVINIADKPATDDNEYHWSNIRYLTADDDNEMGKGFDKPNMVRLRESIRDEGLHYPLICRWITKDETRTVQLVDGERRLRNIDWLVKKNEKCKDPSNGKFVAGRELYEYILCQVYDAPTDKDALKLAYKSGTCRVDFGEEADINLVRELRTKGWSDDDILDVTGNRPEWLRDMDRLIEKLSDDPPTLNAFFKGEINKAAALAFAEVDDLSVRHTGLEQATEFAQEDAKKKVQKLERSIIKAKEDVELAKAKETEARVTGDTEGVQEAQGEQAAAQKRKEEKTQQKGDVKPTVKAKHARQGLRQAGGESTQALRAPKIKKHYIEALEAAIKNSGNDPEDQFLAHPEVLKFGLAVAKGIHDGETEPMKIFRKWGKKLGAVEEK
jgi:hypothetical protein